MSSVLQFIATLSSLLMCQVDTDFKTNLKGDKYSAEVVCKATKVGNSYTYLYSIKNAGENKITINWPTLSKALNQGRDINIMWEVEPGETLNFILEHPDPPQQIGDVVLTTIPSNKDLEKMTTQKLPKGVTLNIPTAKMHRIDHHYATGILPKAFLEPAFLPRR